jgi:septum formation protein
VLSAISAVKLTFMSKQRPVSIILASASLRRRQLLAEAGYKFTVFSPDIDESAFPAKGVKACEYAERLALAKARNVAEKHPDCLVIGADTVVDFNGEIIGKPADAKEAEQITKKLFSGPHKVITAVAIVRRGKALCPPSGRLRKGAPTRNPIELVESEATTVYPRKLTAEQIREHIKSETWRDKAGAYAIKESGDEFIERIEGSLTNVMGLPMALLQRLLKKVVD